MCGWTLGIVEAICISILLGSCVDYVAHIAESYIESAEKAASSGRTYREADFVAESYRKVGVSILWAAATTASAVLMLWFCTIQIFVKVGSIIAASTFIGICTALVPTGALLACCGPRTMKRTCKRQALTVLLIAAFIGAGVLTLFFIHLSGQEIIGPSGMPLFS